jgi:hypothetical protein
MVVLFCRGTETQGHHYCKATCFSPDTKRRLTILDAWTLSWKLERLPLLEAGKITSPSSWKDFLSLKLERLTLLEAGKITSP